MSEIRIESKPVIFDRRWARLGVFMLTWACIAALGFFSTDHYHNDEAAGGWVFYGVLDLPFGMLLWFLGDRFVSNKICKNVVCQLVLTLLAAPALYVFLIIANTYGYRVFVTHH